MSYPFDGRVGTILDGPAQLIVIKDSYPWGFLIGAASAP